MYTAKKYSHQCDQCSSVVSRLKWHLTGFIIVPTFLLIMLLLLVSACFFYLEELVSDFLCKSTTLKNYLKSSRQAQKELDDF